MKKLLLGALVAASVLGTSAIAHAGYYVPTCSAFWNGYFWAQYCG
jgi:hypothetical protein